MAPVPEFESRLRILASPCYLLFSILLCLLHRLYYVIPDAFNHLLDRTAITPHQNKFPFANLAEDTPQNARGQLTR